MIADKDIQFLKTEVTKKEAIEYAKKFGAPLHNTTATTVPTTSDNINEGYSDGSLWYNTSSLRVYLLVDATTGLWADLTSTATTGSFQGFWDANSNTPTLADGVGNNGDYYFVSVAGSQDLGGGTVAFGTGDMVIYDGSIWSKIPAQNLVTSVHGRLGAIVAANGDYTASQVTNIAAGNIVAITTQAAIDELDAQDTTIAGDLSTHIADVANPHAVTKTQVGLGSVDDTSDVNKPVSTAQQTALDGKKDSFTFEREVPAGSRNSVNTTFTLGNTPASKTLSLYLNGLIQTETNDFTITGLTITTLVAPNSDDELIATYNY